MNWHEYRHALYEALSLAEGIDLDRLCQLPGALHFIGNGASASIASHMAADWTKTAQRRAFCYTDAALMSACANDFGVRNIFAVPLKVHVRPRDTLVAISSSGESQNIIEGISAARSKGAFIVTLTGFRPTNRVRSCGDLNIWVPSDRYGIVETTHAAILHAWLDHHVSVICKPDVKPLSAGLGLQKHGGVSGNSPETPIMCDSKRGGSNGGPWVWAACALPKGHAGECAWVWP